MQSTKVPTAVETILKSKLADVKEKHAQLMEAVQTISDHVLMAEGQIVSFVAVEPCSAKDALILAMDVDELLETLTRCYQVVSDGLQKTQMLKMSSRLHVPNCDSNNPTEKSNITIDSNTTAIDVLNVQMEVLQQQISSLQNSQETKLQEQDAMLDSKLNSADIDFNLRLQNVEAKLLLLQDVQVRDDTSIQNAVGELSTLRIDVISLQDDITSIKRNQNVLEGKMEEVRKTTDDIVRLRQILNDLHTNVTQREELTKKVNDLEENVSTIGSILNPFLDEIEKINPNVIVISDDEETEEIIIPSSD